MHHKLTASQLTEYLVNPLQADEKVRQWCQIPEDRYYTVSIWPEAGVVRVNNIHRTVRAKKISKSDQPTSDL